MFSEIVNHSGGTTEGHASEAHALLLLRRAARMGHDVEATPDGGAVITWSATRLGPNGGQAAAEPRSIKLVPHLPVSGVLGDTMRADLHRIATTPGARYANDRDRRVIVGGLWCIPPYVTSRVRARGLVAEEEGGLVRLSLTARLGLLAYAHRTTTTTPEGWHRPADPYGSAGLNRPGGRAGMLYGSACVARCSCGDLSASAGDRMEARRRALGHRRAMARAFVLREPAPVT